MDEGFATRRDYIIGTGSGTAWSAAGDPAAGRIVVVDGIVFDWDTPTFPPDYLSATIDVAGQFVYSAQAPLTSVAGSFIRMLPGGIPSIDTHGDIEAGINVSGFFQGSLATVVRLAVWWHYRRWNT